MPPKKNRPNRQRPEPQDQGGNDEFSTDGPQNRQGGQGGKFWDQLSRYMRLSNKLFPQDPMAYLNRNDAQESQEDAMEDYYDSFSPPAGVPGSGTYIGDQSGISGMAGMGAVQAPQSPYAAPGAVEQLAPTSGGSEMGWPATGPPATGAGAGDLALANAGHVVPQGQPQTGAQPHVPVSGSKEAMNPVEVALNAYNAGFRGDALRNAVAIAFPESGLRPGALNDRGELSHGLWQINMDPAYGASRRKAFGIQDNAQLYDPATNAAAAFNVSGGGKNFNPWTTYTSGKYKPFLDDADAAIAQMVKQLETPEPTTPAPTEPKPEEDEEEE